MQILKTQLQISVNKMIYSEALNFILKKQSLGIKPGLARVKKLLADMGNPQDKIKVIHIAGTNGKGTVAKTIADALQNNGFKTGLFLSPWVVDYREQIQINGDYISEDDFASYVEEYSENDCTEFEMLTAIMYKYFADCSVDYAVVECGMGGAGDATNVEKENLAVITSISLDHTDFLGSTVEKIAEEKSGILRKNSACVLYPCKDLKHIFEPECKKLICVEEQGSVYANNLETVNAVLSEIGVDKIGSLSPLPARQERINGVLLDGGHNFEAAKALALLLNNEIAVIGMMGDKQVDEYLSVVAPKCRKIIAVTPDNPRAMPAEALAEIAKKYCKDVTACGNPREAVISNSNLTLVCGSFYLIREIRNLI